MKKKNRIIIFAVLTLFTLLLTSTVKVEASPATSYTYTLNSKGRMVRTQDAYLPERTIIELNLKDPQDLFFDQEDRMYIADSGNKRIIKYDPNTDEVMEIITHESFVMPTGIFVSEDNILYVADKQAQMVFQFTSEGEFIQSFGTPDEVTFEGKVFDAAKIGVDKAGNMLVYAETVFDGIIQLSDTGEFLGFFTSNDVELSFMERVQDLIFTKEQKAKLFPRTPSIFSNIFVDQQGLVYTTSMNSERQGIKRHNISGGNMFDSVFAPQDPIDVYTNEYGVIFAAMASGSIYIYTQDGDYIFSFGASNFNAGTSDDISGLFSGISSIAIDSTGRIWALDHKKSFIQSFTPTDYANKIYEALDLYYDDRNYEEAVEVWNEVLSLNQMSVLAHNYIGKNYYALQEYEKAMEHFEIAGNRWDYSQAYWEVRNQSLQKYLAPIFLLFVSIIIAGIILKIVEYYYPVKARIKDTLSKPFRYKIVEDLLYIFRVMRHPLDSFYEIKKGNKASLRSTLILFVSFFFLYLWSVIGKDFIYQFVAVEDIDLNSIILGFFGLILLFIICNYLVTSINDGEGTFKNIFMMFVYSLGPLLVALVSVTLLSYVLTYNEAFFLGVLLQVGYGWTGLNILLGVQEIHNYSTRNAIKSILITIAFMLIFIVILIIVIVMWEQLYNFFEAIIREVVRNATN